MSAVTKRVLSIDILRGIVMVIMALDHTRDYFTDFTFNPTDLEHASTAMFFTRWITHFCAPVFIFLSGVSAYLSLSKGKTKTQAAGFLLTRGIWLLILEFTIVRFGWQFNVDYTALFVQVIWAIGWSMIFLAGFVFLPRALILTIGLLMVFGHNAFDGIPATSLGDDGIWWNFVHEFGIINFGNGVTLYILYPLVPWIGVMALGYCFGTIFQRAEAERNRMLYAIGFSAIALFILLRGFNIYGDPTPWQPQAAWWRSVLSFLNCQKYPPSLLYLLMTIGPAITLMPLLERMQGAIGRFFMVYGRVPMFYYVLHIYLIHAMALIGGLMLGLPANLFTDNNSIFGAKPGWGFSLPWVYLYWATAIALLYFPCRWFMYVKMNNKQWWLSYL